MPWGKNVLRQRSAISGRLYRGINMFITARKGEHANYADHRWLTYKHTKAADGHIRKSERGVSIVFWQFPNQTEDSSAALLVSMTTATTGKLTRSATMAPSCRSTPFSTPARPKRNRIPTRPRPWLSLPHRRSRRPVQPASLSGGHNHAQ